MKYKTLLTMVAFAGITQMASAANFTCTNSSGQTDWNDGRTWGGGQFDPVPGSSDLAFIPSGKVVDVSANITVGRINVTGTLNVQAGKLLQVDGTGGSGGTTGHHVIDGTINLQGAASQLQFTSMDQVFENNGVSSGKVVLSDDSGSPAELLIDNTRMLTSQIQIEGYGRVDGVGGTATLVNQQTSATVGAVIVANNSGMLELGSNLILSEVDFVAGLTHYWPQYRANTSSSAVLEFSRDAISAGKLRGDFLVDDCATMQFNADVYTDGSLIMSDGHIVVLSGASFEWAGSDGESPVGTIEGPDTYDAGSCD